MPHPAPVYGQGPFAAHLTKHKLFAILAARLIKTKTTKINRHKTATTKTKTTNRKKIKWKNHAPQLQRPQKLPN
jgi:hypothetical protein